MAFRVATVTDRAGIEALISRAVYGLMSGDDTPEQLDAARQHVFGVDGELLADRSYWLCEHGGSFIAAGEWSRRRSLFGGDQSLGGRESGALLDPAHDSARIRAFFVDPAFARRGLGQALLSLCVGEAARAGFRSLELVTTLSGVPLYAAAGFTRVEDFEVMLPHGVSFRVVRMSRAIASGR